MIAASILIIDRFILILLFGWSVLLEIREAICFLANDPKLSDTQSRSLQRTLADSFWRKLEATSKNTWHCDILI
jgi:hypothetical protein